MATAQILHCLQIPILGNPHSVPRQAFDDDRCGVLTRQHALQPQQIARGDLVTGQQLPESLPELIVLPMADSAPRVSPCQPPVKCVMWSRPVAARANLMAASTDSVPELKKYTASRWAGVR